MLKTKDLINFEKTKPPHKRTVLFVWWHRNGIETSQMCTGYWDEINEDYVIDKEFYKQPTYWHILF